MLHSINHSLAIIGWCVWQAALCHGHTWLPCQGLSGRAQHTADINWFKMKGYIFQILCCLSLPVPCYNCGTHRAFFWTPADSWNSDEQYLFSFLFFYLAARSEATVVSSLVIPSIPIPYLCLLSPRVSLPHSLYPILFVSFKYALSYVLAAGASFGVFSRWMCLQTWLKISFLRSLCFQDQWRWPRFWSICILTKACNKSV